jgi:ribonuclease R
MRTPKTARKTRQSSAGAGSFSGARRGRAAADVPDDAALRDLLLHILKQSNHPVSLDALLRITGLPRREKKRLEALLRLLEAEGRSVRAAGGWSHPARLKLVQGALRVQRTGAGFVTPFQGGPALHIHPTAMGDAWHGDSVEVLALPGGRGPAPEGKIARVLRRAVTELPVRALRRQTGGQWLCAPLDPRLPALFLADAGMLPRPAGENDVFLVKPAEKIGPNLWTALVTACPEQEESPAAQERLTKSLHGIPCSFSPQALAQAERLPPEPAEEDFAGRRDLRPLNFVTIDGRSARDFDDAVHVEEEAGVFRLRVAIADVAHYVPEDSALDREARLRGNSCYFPLSVEPMLPESLSNGLCSLKPLTPRLVMTVDMRFSPDGRMDEAAIYPAVIGSRARLTYGQIRRALLLHDPDEEQRLAPVLPMLRKAEKLARLLMTRRRERGALDFDSPETEILFDDAGGVSRIRPRERHFGHRLIEEFMIAANETVAAFLAKHGQIALYRVHPAPDPDKLRSVVEFLARRGPSDPARPRAGARGVKRPPLTSADLNRMLLAVKGSDREYAVTRLALRSMMQARYQPDNEGHFGLASPCYCHFTSPIRRYADLLVHRAVKKALAPGGGEKKLSPFVAKNIGDHLNETERRAMAAEREIHKRLAILFLRDKTGESFECVISGITDFGVFAQILPCMAEGLLRPENLGKDAYDYDPQRQELLGKRSRQSFRLGQRLRARITDVSITRLEINLSLDDHGPKRNSGRRGRR